MLRPAQPHDTARSTMAGLNPSAVAFLEGDTSVFIEDWPDPDGRWYRLEYRCRADGSRAMAYCLHNPWPPAEDNILHSHLMPDNSICVSADVHAGGRDLEFVVARARFWCTGYSFFREHGIRETRRQLAGEW